MTPFWSYRLISDGNIYREKKQFHRGQKKTQLLLTVVFFGVSGLPSKIDKICYYLFSRGVATHHIVNKKEAFK